MKNSLDKVSLGDILKRSEEWIDIRQDKQYRQVTVKLWGKGVVLRDEVNGTEIAANRRFVIRSDQFILSRIDARNGAFGIVPDSLDGAVVSTDFPVFTLDCSRILPKFLDWMSKTRDFVDLCKAASEGTTNRVRLKEERFLAAEISLPTLEDQQRIVARVEELAARIEAAKGLKKRSIDETSHILEAAMRWLFDFEEEKRTVGDFASVLGGFAFPSGQYTDNGSYQIVRIGNVRDGYLDLSRAPVRWDLKKDSRFAKYRLVEGDILISMTGTRNKRDYGYIAIVPQGQNLLLNQRVGKFIFHTTINRRYLAYFLQSPFFRDHLFPNATGTANQANIGNKHIENVPFDPPSSLEEQQSIVAYLDDLQVKVNFLKQLQSETSAELDALLPSILDKAFKGEL